MPASGPISFEDPLGAASDQAGKYEWMAATDLYKRALERLSSDSDLLEIGRITELLANSFFKAAFQTRMRDEFKQRMKLAETSYENARILYENAGLEGLSKRANARSLFATFWLKDDIASRRETIVRCIEVAEESTQILESGAETRPLAETHGDLLRYLIEADALETEWKPRNDRFEKGEKIGEKAIAEFEELRDDVGLLESLCSTQILLAALGPSILPPPRFQELITKIDDLGEQISQVSDAVRTPYALFLANEVSGWTAQLVEGKNVKALRLFEACISAAEATRDSYLTGRAYSGAVTVSSWVGISGEDVEERRTALEKGISFGAKAVENLEVSSHTGWLNTTYEFFAECFTFLANHVETDLDKKKRYLREAIRTGSKALAYSLVPDAGHALGKALYFLATLEVDSREKSGLLTEALRIRSATARAFDLYAPHSWDRGINRNYLALIKAELSKIEQGTKPKVELLQGAVSDMEECLDQCRKWATTPGFMNAFADYEEWYGDILLQIYQLTPEARTGKNAISGYGEAIAYREKAQLGNPTAPVRWKIAKIFDMIGDYKEASQAFRRAKQDYRQLAKKVPSLKSIFEETGSYMEAWSLIEDARLHHNEDQYLLSAESYTKAADILQTTRSWGYLSKHYVACSFLEGGEALSRQERHEAAIQSFNAALNAFEEAKISVEAQLRQSVGPQARQELQNWIEVTEGRDKYCKGRIELEEAKILDKKGEKEASSTKYHSASKAFKALQTQAQTEQGRSELETLTLFCEAWATMKEADAKASPKLYAEAANLFVNTEEAAAREKLRRIALANASICRALESGSRFRLTRDTGLYSEIKKNLEAATDYYEEAGLQSSAEWTRATGRLFDALAYLANAETEMEPKKKTEFFHLAEKHLQLAAKLYGEAGFASKKEEALRHLKRAREEKELLLTPMEALGQDPASSAGSVAPVSLIRDQALGLERFEAANVVGNLSLSQKELGVGTDFTLELEMANVGRTPATLIKLENICPEGLELDKDKIPFRVEDNYIDMKGKRLEYLKTHEIKISLKAARKGAFELHPRVLFVDEKGNYRSYEFEPVSVTARELGISGWLKGPK